MYKMGRTGDKGAQATKETALWACILRGVILAALISLAGVLLFAMAIKLFQLPDTSIQPVTIGLKVVSALAGAFAAVGSNGSKGFIKGISTGILYMVLGFLIYSLFEQAPSWQVMLSDTGMGALAGALGGILRVNLAGSRR